MQPASLPLEVTAEELEALLESVREGLGEAGYQKLKAAIRTLGYLTELLRERKITLEGLRELLLSGGEASTEKTRHVLQQAGIETQKKNPEKQNAQAKEKPARRGHGRHGVDAYNGAKKVQVPHPSLHSGDHCPCCGTRLSWSDTAQMRESWNWMKLSSVLQNTIRARARSSSCSSSVGSPMTRPLLRSISPPQPCIAN